jgi:hypothetical protein
MDKNASKMKKIDNNNYSELLSQITSQLQDLKNSKNNEVAATANRLLDTILQRKEGGDKLIRDNDVLRIGIVGQVKAGKSSFLNSLFFNGENVLPKASTPMTAGLTILDYGEKEEFVVEYFNDKEWDDFVERAKLFDEEVANWKQQSGMLDISDEEAAKMANVDEVFVAAKELVSSCDHSVRSKIKPKSLVETVSFNGTKGLQQMLEAYVGAEGRYTPIVKSLTLHLNDERLMGVQIVDTPGVNDPVISREQRTKEFLRNSHGVFFLSYAGRFFDSTDVQFLGNRIGSEGICTVVLIGSKFDSALQQEGSKFRGNLEGAIYKCESALRSQFNNNIKDASFSGDRPELTWTSAICYAIATKPKSEWDTTERHTLSRLQDYFPEMFGNSENLSADDKDTLLDISNISTIREQYLEGIFVNNKEKIISDKLNAYFATTNQDFVNIFDKSLKELQSKKAILESTDLNTLALKRALYNDVIKRISSNISNICVAVDEKAERAETKVINSTSLTCNIPIPYNIKSLTFTRETTFWGKDKSFSVDVQIADLSKLCDQLKKFVDSTIASLTSKWEEESEILIKGINEKFNAIITKAEMQDSTGNFDSEILQNMVENTINRMSNRSTVKFDVIRDEFNNGIANALQGLDRISWRKKSMSEADARYTIEQQARDQYDLVHNKVRAFLSPFAQECKDKLHEARENVKKVLREDKKEFLDAINAQSEEFLKDLEQQLTEKSSQLKEYENAIDTLNNIIK